MEMTRSEMIHRLRVLQARAERRRAAMGRSVRTIPPKVEPPRSEGVCIDRVAASGGATERDLEDSIPATAAA